MTAPPPPWPPVALRLVCQLCQKPIDGEHPGHAAVNTAAALMRSAEITRWRRAHPGQDAARHGPRPVCWRLVHLSCDEDGERTYTIAAHRLRTARRVLQQTWRLWSKSWAGATDWPDFTRELLAAAVADDGTTEVAQRRAAAQRAAQGDAGG